VGFAELANPGPETPVGRPGEPVDQIGSFLKEGNGAVRPPAGAAWPTGTGPPGRFCVIASACRRLVRRRRLEAVGRRRCRCHCRRGALRLLLSQLPHPSAVNAGVRVPATAVHGWSPRPASGLVIEADLAPAAWIEPLLRARLASCRVIPVPRTAGFCCGTASASSTSAYSSLHQGSAIRSRA
jgi:hypothetical protein